MDELSSPAFEPVFDDRPKGGGGGRRPRGHAHFGVIARYVSREFIFGLFVCFLFFFAVFFVNQILLMAEDILSKKAPFKDVLLLLVYAMPSMVGMAFPFAALVGALMAAGRLSSDNEMLALMAAGVPTRRSFAPFLVLGLAVSLVSFSMNDYFLPRGNIEFAKLSRKLVASTPALELKPWSSKRYKDVTVVTGDMVGNTIKDLLIFDRTDEGSERVISAEEANLNVDEKRGDVVLSLKGVWEQTIKKSETDRFEWAKASNMEYRLDMTQQGVDSVVVGPRDMPSVDLAKVIADKDASLEAKVATREQAIAAARAALIDTYDAEQRSSSPWANSVDKLASSVAVLRAYGSQIPTDRTLQVYKLEYYKKFSIPFGAICFVFLAFPLGLLAKRSGRAMGFGIGILVAVVYWSFLIGGDALGRRLGWSPFWSMWLPNALVVAAGLGLWLNRLRTR
jgi:Predicted permeases